jgi:hypothetical protein
MNAGGFDTIIGNPPYVEYSKVRKEYQIKGYQTEESGNLYAFVSERSLQLLHKAAGFGFIVPISVVCTQRMQIVQEQLSAFAKSTWVSDYAERPGKLFEGAEVLLTIIVAHGSGNCTPTFTSGFTKWSAEERPHLFPRQTYCEVVEKPKPYAIPKLTVPAEASVLQKMLSQNVLAHHFQKQSKYRVFYRIGGGRYWKIFTNFQPRFVLNGKPSVSSRESYLYFSSEALCDAAITVLSSSVFYWYFVMTTNCRDLNPSDLKEFPINLDVLVANEQKKLQRLCGELMKDYASKGQLKEKTSKKTGEIIYQEFYPRLSKPTIDEIDKVLAEHYGFTEEELDYIINYDIKYRMGKDLQEDEE